MLNTLKKLDDLGKPYKIYADIHALESEAIDQFVNAMKLDCVIQGALMPDAHSGYTLPIGAVIATRGMIFPSFVGYDIGCGMCAVPTTFSRADVEACKRQIFDQIYRYVPTGFDHNRASEEWSYDGRVSDFVKKEIVFKGAPGAQIGTLGGGNHFIEIGHDEQDRIWIVIHSGSRNVGHKIATHYMKLASGDGKAREGHYALDVSSPEGQDYIADLAFGLQFALDNRKTMIRRIEKAIQHALVIERGNPFYKGGAVLWDSLINRNHNHAEVRMMPHDGPTRELRPVWIHRKGATHAETGMLGVIPGNMRDGSFVVRGKGNPDSLFSSSHGAGRVLSRKAAKEQLNMDDFIATMTEKGIQAKVVPGTLDESPMAYKNIFEVMAMQTDLVDVVHHIKPLVNIKGAGKEC